MRINNLIFRKELQEAGLISLPFSYDDDGNFTFSPDVTEQQKEDILSLFDNHDPNGEIPLSAREIRDNALANITWTRPSDSTQIQIRHPDYASDYIVMERARDKLANGESRAWIDINDNPITMTKEDMTDCLDYADNEIDSIFATYIATL